MAPPDTSSRLGQGLRAHYPRRRRGLRAGASVSAAVPSTDAIALADEDRYNCHVAEDQTANFVRFAPPADEMHDLVDVEIEARVMRPADIAERDIATSSSDEDEDGDEDGRAPGQIPRRLTARCSSRRFVRGSRTGGSASARCVTLSYPRDGDDLAFLGATSLRMRVARCDTIDADRRRSSRWGTTATGGCVVTDTRVYVHAVDDPGDDDGGVCVTVGGGLRLVNSNARGGSAAAAAAARELVSVNTSDGETFPVHRRLLRPCIALTRAIREAGADGPAVSSGKRREGRHRGVSHLRRVSHRAVGTAAGGPSATRRLTARRSTGFSSGSRPKRSAGPRPSTT